MPARNHILALVLFLILLTFAPGGARASRHSAGRLYRDPARRRPRPANGDLDVPGRPSVRLREEGAPADHLPTENALLPTSFLQVEVYPNGERGLLGMTFDPDFEHNGYVYIYYTARKPRRTTGSAGSPPTATWPSRAARRS